MANSSIPNSIPANGRISTPSSRRSAKRAEENESGKQESRKRFSGSHSLVLSSLSCFPAFLIQFLPIRRVKGAWWPSRSSKSPSVLTGRGRFDSYPLRLFPAGMNQESRKAGNVGGAVVTRASERYVYRSLNVVGAQNPKLFFLLSCFPDSVFSRFERRWSACRVNRFAP